MISSLPKQYKLPSLTNHSLRRMAQRGIAIPDIQAVMAYGRKCRVRKAKVHVIGKKEVRQAEKRGVDLRDYEGVHVICSPEGVVMTVYRNQNLNIREKCSRRSRRV